MASQDFNITAKFVWFLIIGNAILVSIGAYMKIIHWPFWNALLITGLILHVLTSGLLIHDMVKNKVYNMTFWVTSMLIMPQIASIVYLIQRDKLIKFGSK